MKTKELFLSSPLVKNFKLNYNNYYNFLLNLQIDGDFELTSYRLDVKVKPLFSVDVIIQRPSTGKIEFMVKAKSNFK